MIIYLTGYMGSGKSRYGKVAARHLGFEFFDLDELIEERAGMKIREIFRISGEEAFRNLEHEMLIETVPEKDAIISTGGGAACSEENMRFMNEHGVTIYIKLHPKSLSGRLKLLASSRPLLSPHLHDLDGFVERHLAEREPFYLRSQSVVKGEGLTGKKLAEVISGLIIS